MSSVNRFDLEQLIMLCWSITEDIDLVIKKLNSTSAEEVNTQLEGIKIISNLRFNALFDAFENMVKNKQLN